MFDDSDIAIRYGKKFGNLDRVIDASSINKEGVNGVDLGKEENNQLVYIVKYILVKVIIL